ncbi:hypothetical protein [Nocardia abscessus]|uniref:hypothetical protein n=1 Tax=Nocardia abscessus TaxID=120957 RepID=UPI0024545F75|nr:hypothetical protein [Nocardia abscessus]
MSKPYDVQFSTPQEGDRIGWQDSDGVVHVERLKRFTSNGVELEPDPVQRAHDALSAALDEVLDVESRLRAIIGDEGEKA